MVRKMMTREVTKTTVKVAKMEMQDGVPVAVVLPEETFIGNIKLDRAQREVNKKYPKQSVSVLEVNPETLVYEMSVEDFIEHATIKVVEEEKESETN